LNEHKLKTVANILLNDKFRDILPIRCLFRTHLLHHTQIENIEILQLLLDIIGVLYLTKIGECFGKTYNIVEVGVYTVFAVVVE